MLTAVIAHSQENVSWSPLTCFLIAWQLSLCGLLCSCYFAGNQQNILHQFIQRYTGQILGQLPFFIGSRDIFKVLITDQPKGHPGLIYKAEEEGKSN